MRSGWSYCQLQTMQELIKPGSDTSRGNCGRMDCPADIVCFIRSQLATRKIWMQSAASEYRNEICSIDWLDQTCCSISPIQFIRRCCCNLSDAFSAISIQVKSSIG